MTTIRIALALLVLCPAVLRGGLDYRVMAGDPLARASGELVLRVALTNPDQVAAVADLPEEVTARVGTATVLLRREAPGPVGEVQPSSTVLVVYRGVLPGDLVGLLAVELDEIPAGRCFVEVTPAPSTDPEGAPAVTLEAEPPAVRAGRADGDAVRGPRFARNLSFYEPIYFVIGPRVTLNAKFQLSFKYRLLSLESNLAEEIPVLGDIHFGYTQTSLWDLGSESKPFLDTSYKPGLFYHGAYQGIRFLGFELMSLETGYQHESNGQGGDASRSLNIVYVRPRLDYELRKDWFFSFSPKAWVYVDDLSDNPDLAEYRGYFDFNFKIGERNGIELSTTLRVGTDSGKGSLQVDLTYPLDRLFFGNAASHLHLQYFDGWGETLLNYDQRLPAQYRIGITLLR
jgi:outer membrane phospholipase A